MIPIKQAGCEGFSTGTTVSSPSLRYIQNKTPIPNSIIAELALLYKKRKLPPGRQKGVGGGGGRRERGGGGRRERGGEGEDTILSRKLPPGRVGGCGNTILPRNL